MPSLNRVFLLGNMTRDPQTKHLPSGTVVCEFGLAVNRKYRTQAGEEREDVLFVDCSAFARTAEVISQYMTKGKPILIEGRMVYESWEDKQGGGKRSKISVAVESFQFIESRGGGFGSDDDRAAGVEKPTTAPGRAEQRSRGESGSKWPGDIPLPRRQQRPAPTQAPFSENQEFTESEIPFRWEGRRGQDV